MIVSFRYIRIFIAVSCMLFLGYIPSLNAQTTFKVTYSISKLKLHGSIDNLDEKGKQFTKQLMERAKDVDYTLITDLETSYFEAEKTLNFENESSMDNLMTRMIKKFPGFNEKTYTNHRTDSIVFVKNLVDKEFLVKMKSFNFNWVLKNENKTILGYDAKKAEGTYYYPVTDETLNVEAWFIPSIPLQSGPDIFMGLPGLIAEIEIKGAIVTVKKIQSIKELNIDKIDTSKAMSQEDYNQLIKRLTKRHIDN